MRVYYESIIDIQIRQSNEEYNIIKKTKNIYNNKHSFAHMMQVQKNTEICYIYLYRFVINFVCESRNMWRIWTEESSMNSDCFSLRTRTNVIYFPSITRSMSITALVNITFNFSCRHVKILYLVPTTSSMCQEFPFMQNNFSFFFRTTFIEQPVLCMFCESLINQKWPRLIKY